MHISFAKTKMQLMLMIVLLCGIIPLAMAQRVEECQQGVDDELIWEYDVRRPYRSGGYQVRLIIPASIIYLTLLLLIIESFTISALFYNISLSLSHYSNFSSYFNFSLLPYNIDIFSFSPCRVICLFNCN